MESAAAPYIAWMNTTAALAGQAADRARTVVTAYAAAFATTVPPSVITTNLILLTSLTSTNVFGQNTAAIAVAEAHYTQMWAMVTPAAAASTLTPFTFSTPDR